MQLKRLTAKHAQSSRGVRRGASKELPRIAMPLGRALCRSLTQRRINAALEEASGIVRAIDAHRAESAAASAGYSKQYGRELAEYQSAMSEVDAAIGEEVALATRFRSLSDKLFTLRGYTDQIRRHRAELYQKISVLEVIALERRQLGLACRRKVAATEALPARELGALDAESCAQPTVASVARRWAAGVLETNKGEVSVRVRPKGTSWYDVQDAQPRGASSPRPVIDRRFSELTTLHLTPPHLTTSVEPTMVV